MDKAFGIRDEKDKALKSGTKWIKHLESGKKKGQSIEIRNEMDKAFGIRNEKDKALAS